MENISKPSTQNSNQKQVIIIFTSILGAICLITVCLSLGVYYTYNIFDQQQKLYTKEQESLTATAKEQEFLTATAQAHATSTAIYQRTQVANYEFFDDFKNNKNHWYSKYVDSDYWDGEISVHDGMYVWDIKEIHKAGSYFWGGYENNIPVNDFDMSVDAKVSALESTYTCYGVAFRVDPRGFSNGAYHFSVCDDQQFSVTYQNDVAGDGAVLKPWTFSNIIRSRDWNTLAISARGDRFILYINNSVVFDFTDKHMPRGYVYLMMNTFDVVPDTLMFDNFGLQIP